jgi:hypothetical protein
MRASLQNRFAKSAVPGAEGLAKCSSAESLAGRASRDTRLGHAPGDRRPVSAPFLYARAAA